MRKGAAWPTAIELWQSTIRVVFARSTAEDRDIWEAHGGLPLGGPKPRPSGRGGKFIGHRRNLYTPSRSKNEPAKASAGSIGQRDAIASIAISKPWGKFLGLIRGFCTEFAVYRLEYACNAGRASNHRRSDRMTRINALRSIAGAQGQSCIAETANGVLPA